MDSRSLASGHAAGELLVYRHSDRWVSALETAAMGSSVVIRSFEQWNTMSPFLGTEINLVLAWEFHPDHDLTALERLSKFAQHSGAPVFLLGSPSLTPHRTQIRPAGFAEVFGSTTEASRLIKMAQRHLNKRPPSSLSIEKRVDRNLPWAPFSDESGNSACQGGQSGKH